MLILVIGQSVNQYFSQWPNEDCYKVHLSVNSKRIDGTEKFSLDAEG